MPFSQLDVSTPKPIGHGYTKEPQTIGNHIRNKRLRLKLEQKDLARLLGIKYRTVASWEIRGVVPHWEHFPKIIQFLGYNPLPMDNITIPGKTKLCCVLKGLSKLQLSRQLSIDARRLKDWEDGKGEPEQGVKDKLEQMLSELAPSKCNY